MPDVCKDVAGLIVTSVFLDLKNLNSAGAAMLTAIAINRNPEKAAALVSRKGAGKGMIFCM